MNRIGKISIKASVIALHLLALPIHRAMAVAWSDPQFDCLEPVTYTYVDPATGDPVTQTANDVATIQCLEPLFQNIIQAVVSLVGVVLFLMLVLGGFRYIISGGDPKNLDKAKKTITYAIIGMFLIVVSYLILKTIEVFTGVNVTRFSVPR